jgi:hypothetical protein
MMNKESLLLKKLTSKHYISNRHVEYPSMTAFLQHIVQASAAEAKRAEAQVGTFSSSRRHVMVIFCNSPNMIGGLYSPK